MSGGIGSRSSGGNTVVAVRLATAVRDECGTCSPLRPTPRNEIPKSGGLHHAGGGPGSIISARPVFDWPRCYLDDQIKIGEPSDSKNHRLVV